MAPGSSLLSRRGFAAGAAAALATVASRAAADAPFQYKLAHDLPVEHPLHVRMVSMCDEIKRLTNGRLVITVFPFGQLGAGQGLVQIVRSGAVQFASTASFLWSGTVPVAAIDSLGFIFTDVKQAFRLMAGPLGKYVRDAFADKGMYAFPDQWDLGMRQITSSTKPIANLSDLAGFKIRTPSAKVSFDLFQTLGASPVVVDSTSQYTAMKTHLVDGQETPFITIESFRLYEVQSYINLSSHQWTGYWVVANSDAWKALPPDIEAIVTSSMAKYAALERNDVAITGGAVAEKLHRQGMTFGQFDRTGVRAKLAPYYDRWKAVFGSTAWDMLEAGVGKLT